MQAEPTVVEHLNAVLKVSFGAINQYFLHARMLGNWGFKGFEKVEYDASILAMKHADRLMERILFLESIPDLHDMDRLAIGKDVAEIVQHDLGLESRYRDTLAKAVAGCEQARDFVSRHHLEELQEDSEERIDVLETQLSLVGSLGLENYLQTGIR